MSSKSFTLNNYKSIKPFKKIIEVDSDKSLSIRSFLIGAISQGISKTHNVLESEDVYSTINCLKKLRVKIEKIKPKSYLVYGKGLGSLIAKKNSQLDFGNSGTLARLLISILSTTPNIEIKIKGDHSLNKRNMKKLINIMSEFGAEFLPKKKFNFPLKLISTEMPIGINYKAGVSAQLKSAVILAGLNSFGTTKIIEEEKSRDHTENMLIENHQAFKIKNGEKKIIKIFGKRYLNSNTIDIPGDPSSAAFFTALTLLNKNSSLKIKNVGLNPTRIGFYELLKKHGAKIKFKNIKKSNNEIYGDIHVDSKEIKPIKASKKYYTKATDEYPILFVIAALTQGTSIFRGIGDLANKESNRIKEMQIILRQIGIKSSASKNEIKIYGKKFLNIENKKLNVPNLGDHRICMSALILSLITGVKAKINNFETVYTSSPSFLKIIKSLGGKFEIKK
jgi:3-phosphoshikimate 1-carboxyvinyltransferase